MNGVLTSGAPINIFSVDATTGVSGNYALGMFSQDYSPPVDGIPKDDAFLVHFDASTFNYLYVEGDIASASLPNGECLTNQPYDANTPYQPVLHLVLADWQGNPFDWTNINILDECTVSGSSGSGNNLVSPPFNIEWSRRSCSLSTNGSTNGQVALLFNFEEGSSGISGASYNLLDNLEIIGSSVSLVGFNTVELVEGTQGNQAHFTLNAGTDGRIDWELRESDCSAITTNSHVLTSYNGGAQAQTGSDNPYIAGSDVQVDLHLDGLFSYFQLPTAITPYAICCKFALYDASNTLVDQKLMKVNIELNVVDLGFAVQFSVDSDSITTETLTKSNPIGVSLVDQNGNPITGSASYAPGDIVHYQVSVPPGTAVNQNSFSSNLIAPASGGAAYPLIVNGNLASDSSLNPTIVFSTGAAGSINLSPEFLAPFADTITMSIEGTFNLDSANGRRLAAGGLFTNDEQTFKVAFSVKIPKKERLNAAASGGIAVGIIALTVGAFAFISYDQRHKAPVCPDQKSVTSVKTCTTASSTKSPKSYRSSPSTRPVHPGQKTDNNAKTHTTSSSTKNPKSYRSSSPTHPLPEIRFSPASIVAMNAKMLSDRPKH
mmetsp:Transcript_30227/g.88396  ORF Transcript_30227/g.88396 Transcript_30227/m.88396 type:complete len:603 (+) Transcript_30227:182-1990(+)